MMIRISQSHIKTDGEGWGGGQLICDDSLTEKTSYLFSEVYFSP